MREQILMNHSTSLLLAFALFCGLVSLTTWYVFLRPVPKRTAVGVVIQKTLKPASVYWQYPTGMRRNFWTPARIPIAECFVFAIRLDEPPVEAFFSLNTTAARAFEVGQKVEIVYEVRGIPMIWQRVYVMDMRPVEGP